MSIVVCVIILAFVNTIIENFYIKNDDEKNNTKNNGKK